MPEDQDFTPLGSPRPYYEHYEDNPALPPRVMQLTELLNGANDDEYTYWAPSYIGGGSEGMVFVAERHPKKREYSPQSTWRSQARFDYVTIKAPKGKPERLLKERDRRNALKNLPFLGASPSVRNLRDIDNSPLSDRHDVNGLHLPSVYMITPLRLDSSGGPAPVSLRRFISRGVNTHRELSNWIGLARSLAQALWSLHSLGYAHRDIKPDNIVLRSSFGQWYDISLIDFGLLTTDELKNGGLNVPGTFEYRHPGIARLKNDDLYLPSQNDVYALGVTLAEVFRGYIWAKKKGRDSNLKTSLINNQDLDVSLANEIREELTSKPTTTRDEALKLTLEQLLEVRLSSDDRDKDQSMRVLQDFLGALENLRAATAMHAMHYPSRGHSSGISYSALAPQLASARQFGEDQKIHTLCQKYVTIHDEHQSDIPTYEYSALLLRQGYGQAAKRELRRLLDYPNRQQCNEETIIASLRLYAVVCLRDCDFHSSLDILKLYHAPGASRVNWWARMLYMRLHFHKDHDNDETKGFLNEVPPLWLEKDARASAWMTALKVHCWLHDLEERERKDKAIGKRWYKGLTSERIEEIERHFLNVDVISSYEECYIALLLARVYSTPTMWHRVPATLLTAIGRAHQRRLPHEHAAALAIGSTLIRRAFEGWQAGRGVVGAGLHLRGADADECLYWAAECAFASAEMYHHLQVPTMSLKASETAAKCLELCEAPEYKVLAIQRLSYARNRYVLQGGTDVLRYRKQFRGMVASWQIAARKMLNVSRNEDPGSFLSRGYYNRFGGFGAGIDHVLKVGTLTTVMSTSGVSAEALPGSTETMAQLISWAKDSIATLEGAENLRILDWGCGSGQDAFYLAACGYSVMGVDASAWAISSAESDKSSHKIANVSFNRADLTVEDWQCPATWGHFDVVTCRGSLYRLARRTLLLNRLYSLLKKGGVLLIADLVQQRECSAMEYDELCRALEIPGLETPAQYEARLSKATTWTSYLYKDMTAGFILFLERRRTQLEERTKEGGALVQKTYAMLTTVIKLLKNGVLGWMFFAAVAQIE